MSLAYVTTVGCAYITTVELLGQAMRLQLSFQGAVAYQRLTRDCRTENPASVLHGNPAFLLQWDVQFQFLQDLKILNFSPT